MRNCPDMNDEDDVKELKNLNAEDWMIECLKMNPEYTSWGNGEDYMCTKEGGWSGALEFETIEDGLFELDELNELVNFYFSVNRKNEKCETCDSSGYNPETKQISGDWYDFANTGRKWCYKLTEVEIKELVKRGRLSSLIKNNCSFNKEENKWYSWVNGIRTEVLEPEYPTPEQVNSWAQKGSEHDSINHWICTEARAKHLGVWGKCPHCKGDGYIYTEEKANVSLQLWMLHPRKGCSRGVLIKNIKREDLLKIFKHLKNAAIRNAERFSKLNNISDVLLPYFIMDELVE